MLFDLLPVTCGGTLSYLLECHSLPLGLFHPSLLCNQSLETDNSKVLDQLSFNLVEPASICNFAFKRNSDLVRASEPAGGETQVMR